MIWIGIIISLIIVIAGINAAKTKKPAERAKEENKGKPVVKASALLTEFPNSIIIKNGIISHPQNNGGVLISMEIKSIRKILRDNADRNPSYNKYYKDSLVLIDDHQREIFLKGDIPKGGHNYFDDIFDTLMSMNPDIHVEKYYRQIMTDI